MTVTATGLGLTAGTWNIDPAHSEVGFAVRHLMTKVRGVFTDFSGAIEVAEDVTASTVTAEIAVGSIDTRNADRDGHVRSGDILGSEEHPAITFRTTGVRADGGENLLDGELTVRGITLPITLTVEFHGVDGDPWGGTRAGFSAAGSISRKAYGIDFNIPLGGDKALLGDKIEISLEIQAVRA